MDKIRVMAAWCGIIVWCRACRGTLVCMPGHECKPITSLLGGMNGLGDETSTGAQRAASDARKEGRKGSRGRSMHTGLRDLTG